MSERLNYLQLNDFERLEEWCRHVRTLFDGAVPYLVGSANERSDFRDVDVRLILPDASFDAAWGNRVKVRLMNRAVSTWGQRETGLPIDFQIQRMSEAEAFPGVRNPMGVRDWADIPTSGTP
jgi:hypothetical protein